MERRFERDGFTVIVTHVLDESPDLSYLEQDYADESEMDRKRYLAQDAKRLKGYANGDWFLMGITVQVRKQTDSNWADGGLEVGRASCWGYESDSEERYLVDAEKHLIDEAFWEVEKLRAVLCVGSVGANK